MRGFLHRLVERLHDDARPLSRNRHFHVFSGGGGKSALRIDRHLRDLEIHLEALRARGERPRVRRLENGGAQIVLADARLSVVRTAILSAEDVALLAKHPAGAWALENRDDESDRESQSSSAAGAKK